MKLRVRHLVAFLVLATFADAITGARLVKFASSLTNEHGVKLIVVRCDGGHPSYTLGCNDGESDCVTPDPGVWYTLKPSPTKKYTDRENVVLLLSGDFVGNYFLVASEE